MLSTISAYFFPKHPHLCIFDSLNERLPEKSLCHLVVSFGGISLYEINCKITEILTNNEWHLSRFKQDPYWMVFARHLTAIRIPSVYFYQENYFLSLERIRETVRHILKLTHQKVMQEMPVNPLVTTLQSTKSAETSLTVNTPMTEKTDALEPPKDTCVIGLKVVAFGTEPTSKEVARSRDFIYARHDYDDGRVIQFFKTFLPCDLEEIIISHPITLRFFEHIIIPMKKLKCLAMDTSRFSSFPIYSDFSPKNPGFNNRLNGINFKPYIIQLPKTMETLPTTDFHMSDDQIEFLADSFPMLEILNCQGECRNRIFDTIVKFKNLKRLILKNGCNFTVQGLSKLRQSTIQDMFIYGLGPTLPVLAEHLPITLETLQIGPASFKPSDISSLGAFPRLKKLVIGWLGEESDGFIISRLSQSNPLLEELHFGHCHLQEKEIFQIVKKFPHLRKFSKVDPTVSSRGDIKSLEDLRKVSG